MSRFFHTPIGLAFMGAGLAATVRSAEVLAHPGRNESKVKPVLCLAAAAGTFFGVYTGNDRLFASAAGAAAYLIADAYFSPGDDLSNNQPQQAQGQERNNLASGL